MSDKVSMQHNHLLVEGRVQGVGFRWFVRERARRAGLSGWVKNRVDGTVEIRASGAAESMERFLSQLTKGPDGATVDTVRQLDDASAQPLPYPFLIIR